MKLLLERPSEEYSNLILSTIDQYEIISSRGLIADYSKKSVTNLILSKSLYPFIFKQKNKKSNYKPDLILCIYNIDWENRNCQMIGRILSDYFDDREDLNQYIKLLLNFCKNEIRMHKVWGLLKKDNIYYNAVNNHFHKKNISNEFEINYFERIL
ncbi:hypothetical protein [Senegalia massiliensis]|uniref:Uncharacterized protein n=1 Tax=Senegalia massiliensis TaxID=1720316 RepID=A0A845QU95_9CLOT|nr:hypothetical protein [Senegalia massiliensis]NBI06437.1 hypothetical protein [Senegalia massiliensis]